MKGKQITAVGFMRAGARSHRSGPELVTFRELREKLERNPLAMERVAFEFVRMTRAALKCGTDPSIGGYAFQFHHAVTKANEDRYCSLVEKIIEGLFTAVEQSSFAGDDSSPEVFTLQNALIILRIKNEARFRTITELLRKSTHQGGEHRFGLLSVMEAGKSVLELDKKIKNCAVQVRKEQIEAETRLLSFKN